MKTRIYSIYCLVCPLTEEIKYVGQTTQPLWKRLNGHLTSAKKFKRRNAKHVWILSLLEDNIKPIIKLLTTEDNPVSAFETEKKFIAKYKETILNYQQYSSGAKSKRTYVHKKSGFNVPSLWKPIIAKNIITSEIIRFESLIKASNELKIFSSAITNCLYGDRQSANGWTFIFGDADISKFDEKRPQLVQIESVDTFGNIKTYKSISEAARETGLDRRELGRYITIYKNRKYGDLYWRKR